MTTADPLAAKMEDLRQRAEDCNSWLWDNWQLIDTETYLRVESQWRQILAEMDSTRRLWDALHRPGGTR